MVICLTEWVTPEKNNSDRTEINMTNPTYIYLLGSSPNLYIFILAIQCCFGAVYQRILETNWKFMQGKGVLFTAAFPWQPEGFDSVSISIHHRVMTVLHPDSKISKRHCQRRQWNYSDLRSLDSAAVVLQLAELWLEAEVFRSGEEWSVDRSRFSHSYMNQWILRQWPARLPLNKRRSSTSQET